MKRNIYITVAAFALVISLGACKQDAASETAVSSEPAQASSIDGTWMVDLASVEQTGKPTELALAGGKYTCASCVPALTVAADGEFHPVTGLDYADEISVKVDSPTQVTIAAKKGGMAMGSTVLKVSSDGRTLTRSFTDTSIKDAKPVTGSAIMTRVGDAPAGAHAISGKWSPGKFENYSEEGLTVTYASTPSTLKITSPDGTSADAPLDGSDAAIKGDPAGATVSVTKPGEKTWRIVTKINGNAVSTTEMTLDGDTLHIENTDAKTSNKTAYDAKRK